MKRLEDSELELDWTGKTGLNWNRTGKNWKEQKELVDRKNWKEQNWTGRFGTNGTSFRFICKNRFLSLGATMKS